ncbi:protein IN2-1 homolog B-like isoform X2 [Rhododendron vialii]|uniref:protein IN2-1 homolog B-like isoform X2 n=1 Tax=Rhododendron vialii TaxID=182163 RepID=UPI0026601BF5|nr:protein IN2-1 homolog B-like isoform X2 [Rhododendron vialii]
MTSSSYANLLSTSPFHKVAHKLPSYSLPLQALCLRRSTRPFSNKTSAVPKAAIATEGEVLPPVLDSSSEPPPLFDGTTRLYTSYICPYAQRVWIARNSKEKIKLVPIDLEDRPSWYKEKVYPPNKVPSLEHDNEVRGESLDLMKYIDSSFEGPALYPNDPAMREFAEELLSYSDTFNRAVLFSLKGESLNEISLAVNYLETALSKFSDGPFFLGQFSLVDIAYAPFVERFHPLLLEVKNYDITTGRPTLRSWIENVNKIEAYKQTKRDPQELVAVLKKRFSIK